jgi:hypothetical protein
MGKIMKYFLERISLNSSRDMVLAEMNEILTTTNWGSNNQIGLNRRPEAFEPWHDACGSLFNKLTQTYFAEESDFSVWNLEENSYIKQQIDLLAAHEGVAIGRCRFMLLNPKTGLSVHEDREVRYHLVLQTNSKSYIALNEIDHNVKKSMMPSRATCYHIPADDYWYRVDTRRSHWVYNGGGTDRIHLVVCATDLK